MQIDIQGKINEKKLSYQSTLLPLFEAIVNSLHSIEEDASNNPGIVTIDVIRSTQTALNLESEAKQQIFEFHITDNGVGFHEKNFESFNFAHSTYKISKGGKGIGRFIWLRAFQKAEIESFYKENGHYILRKFNFEPTKNGIENHKTEKHETIEKRYTTVRLRNMKEDYRKWCNNNIEDIAFKIIEHCFIYFLRGDTCPRIIIKDGLTEIVVNDLFKLFTKDNVHREKITSGNRDFEINIARLYHTKRMDNKIHFVAHTREVENKELSLYIPELDNYVSDSEGQKFSIGAYLTGDYFDERVNEERTKIQFAELNVAAQELFTEVDENELINKVVDVVKNVFSDNINQLEKVREERISNYISENPQYKQLLKYKPDQIRKISSKLTDEKLEIELFKVKQELDLEVKTEANKVVNQIDKIDDIKEFAEFKTQNEALYTKIIDVGNAKLSEYILYRKFILEFLERHLNKTTDGKFAKEEVIHKLIFPLKSESDDISHDGHNLWIIDERLAFHKYLASDKSFKQNKVSASTSLDRPDLLIFNKPFALSDSEKPYSSIIIIEFKRPMRDDYTDEENPINQVTKYTRELLENKITDKNGRQFDLRPNTPIYAFIVCDLTPNLRTQAEDNSFVKFPDNDGYFKFNQNYALYIEIISFDKLIRDSKQRNKVLFEKLNV